MRRLIIDPAGFEAKFQENIDPWNYAASPFEAYKRAVLLHACGSRVHGRGLELACAIGETTRMLSPRCLRLLAVDSSATALKEAARRTKEHSNVTLGQALLPRQMPRGPFDLIVASEILYYLRPNDLRILIDRLDWALAPGGRLVILHHLKDFGDAAVRPRLAQQYAVAALRHRMPLRRLINAGRFQVAALVKARFPSAVAAKGVLRACPSRSNAG
jgi:SAM-dependent methyltransferase